MCTKMFEVFPTTLYTIFLFLGVNLHNLTPAEAAYDIKATYPGRFWAEPLQCDIVHELNRPTLVDCLMFCTEYDGDICNAVTYNPHNKKCKLYNCPIPVPLPLGIDHKLTGYVIGQADPVKGYKAYPGHCWVNLCDKLLEEFSVTLDECLSQCTGNDDCTAASYFADEKKCILFNCTIPVQMPEPIDPSVTGYAIGQGYNICPGKKWPAKPCQHIDEDYPSSKDKCPISCQRNPWCNAAFYNDKDQICTLQVCYPDVPTRVYVACPKCTGFATTSVSGCAPPENTSDGLSLDISQKLD